MLFIIKVITVGLRTLKKGNNCWTESFEPHIPLKQKQKKRIIYGEKNCQ